LVSLEFPSSRIESSLCLDHLIGLWRFLSSLGRSLLCVPCIFVNKDLELFVDRVLLSPYHFKISYLILFFFTFMLTVHTVRRLILLRSKHCCSFLETLHSFVLLVRWNLLSHIERAMFMGIWEYVGFVLIDNVVHFIVPLRLEVLEILIFFEISLNIVEFLQLQRIDLFLEHFTGV
jgi:hypothetical protein